MEESDSHLLVEDSPNYTKNVIHTDLNKSYPTHDGITYDKAL